MSRQVRRRPRPFRSSPLYLEPLEDRLLLSGLHTPAGAYSSSGKHAGAAVSSSSAREYSTSGGYQASGHTSHSSAAVSIDHYAQQASHDMGNAANAAAGEESYQQAEGSAGQSAAPAPAEQDPAARAAAVAPVQSDRPAPGQPAAPAAEGAPTTPAAPAAPAPAGAPGRAVLVTAGGRAGEALPGAHAVRPPSAADLQTDLAAPSEQEPDAELPLEEAAEATAVAGAAAVATYAPQVSGVVVGALPVDLAVLERGAEQFFVHLGDLGEEVPGLSVVGRLAPWLGAVAAATVGLELARRTVRKQSPRRPAPAVRPTPDEA
jgi:hypothetical protein